MFVSCALYVLFDPLLLECSVGLFLTLVPHALFVLIIISNGNRTEWSPMRSVIIRVIKSDDRAAGVRYVYHEYDYRPNWTTRSLITN